MKITSLIIIIGCIGTGVYFKFFSDRVDSAPEQVAERVLAEFGIDVDFSSDKKKSR